MAKAEWGAEPEFFGPRHAHREGRILRELRRGTDGAGLHLECAAGVGSLARTLHGPDRTVVAADQSLRSLAVIRRRTGASLPLVVCDILALPFGDATFASATSAETLEHIDRDDLAAGELARVLRPGGILVGTVPAGPKQFSDWDLWADHKRRYTRSAMETLLEGAGLRPRVRVWGWPVLRVYDGLFLKRVNRRRLRTDAVQADPSLRTVSALGKRRGLVATVRACFEIDRLFDGLPWGVGLLFAGRKPETP